MCIARTKTNKKCKLAPDRTYCHIHSHTPKAKSKSKSKSTCKFKISPSLRKSIVLRKDGYYYWKSNGLKVGKYVNGDGRTLFPHPAICG